MLIRPGHSPKHTARADGQEVRGLQSCSSEQAESEQGGAKRVVENSTANEKSEPHT